MIKDDFLVLFVYFFLFTEDDFSFSFDGIFFKFGVLEDVGDDVDAGRCVLFEAAGVINGLFTGSVGV